MALSRPAHRERTPLACQFSLNPMYKTPILRLRQAHLWVVHLTVGIIIPTVVVGIPRQAQDFERTP
jgi:hypothetical protein